VSIVSAYQYGDRTSVVKKSAQDMSLFRILGSSMDLPSTSEMYIATFTALSLNRRYASGHEYCTFASAPTSSISNALYGLSAAKGPDLMLWAALVVAPPQGTTVPDLMTATGMSRPWIYLRLRDLAEQGHVIQVSRGRWRAVTDDAP
jgi:hypothetical protein